MTSKSYSILFFFCTGFLFSCQGQTDNSTASWKEVKFEKVSFKYPKDWTFEKQTFQGNILLTTTPDTLSNIKTLKAFEIIRIDPQGHSFNDFKRDFIQAATGRTHEEANIINKKDSTYKNLKATYAEVILYSKSNPIPARLFAIDGGDKFYMITILSRLTSKSTDLKMKEITNTILNTLTINK